MAKNLKVGVVGCGGIAVQKHLEALREIPEAEVVALCDVQVERAKAMSEKYNLPEARIYTDFRKMMEQEALNSVHVLTPNKSHSEISIPFLEKGIAVMCEKPMAKTAEAARAMVAAAEKSGALLTIGYQNRFTQDARYLKRACDRGDLGEIYFAKAHAVRRRAVPTWGVFLDAEAQGGGPLIDIGTHALDLTLWMMNNYEPKLVVGNTFRKLADQTETGNAFGDWDPTKFTVEDSAFGYIVMKNGAVIFLESSWALNILDTGEAQTTLCGTLAGATTRGGLKLNKVEFNRPVTITPAGAAGVDFFEEDASATPAVLEARSFYDALQGKGELVVQPRQALVVTEILEALYRSSETGQPVLF